MPKCPFCGADIALLNKFEFSCPVCRQLVGVTADGPSPRLVRAAPDSRKSRVLPFFRDH
ncbi:MAG: hypothetical protein ACUVXF_12385 [Desulfobaccales bacterium]